MKVKFNKLMFLGLFLAPVISQATTQPELKNDLKVTANVQAGCNLITEDINIGDITVTKNVQLIRQDTKINIQCSKNAELNIFTDTGLYGNKYGTNYMKHVDSAEKILYFLNIQGVPTETEHYSLLQKNSDGLLGSNPSYYTFTLRIKSKEAFDLGFTLYADVGFQTLTGVYTDQLTYRFVF